MRMYPYPVNPVSDSCNVCHNVLALTCALVCLCRGAVALMMTERHSQFIWALSSRSQNPPKPGTRVEIFNLSLMTPKRNAFAFAFGFKRDIELEFGRETQLTAT